MGRIDLLDDQNHYLFGVLDGTGGSLFVDNCIEAIPKIAKTLYAEQRFQENPNIFFVQIFRDCNAQLEHLLPEESKTQGCSICLMLIRREVVD